MLAVIIVLLIELSSVIKSFHAV